MADTYYSWTLPFPESEIPVNLAPADKSLPDVIGTAMGQDGVLNSAARGDWLYYALAQVFSAFHGSALAFLIKDPESLPGDRIAGFKPVGAEENLWFEERWLVTALPHADISSALAEVDSWLAVAATHPERFDGVGIEIDTEISEAVMEAGDLLREGPIYDEDVGQTIYFFSFLKGLRTVLLDAQARGMAVLHVRFVLLFSKMERTPSGETRPSPVG